MTAAAGSGALAPEFTEPAPKTRPSATGVLGEVSSLVSSARRTVSGFFELVVLEARRAGIALAWMIGLGVGAAILGVTAWLGLMAMLAMLLVAMGLGPILAMLLVVVLNLAAAGSAAFVCVKMSKDLTFEASRRQLKTRAAELPAQP